MLCGKILEIEKLGRIEPRTPWPVLCYSVVQQPDNHQPSQIHCDNCQPFHFVFLFPARGQMHDLSKR